MTSIYPDEIIAELEASFIGRNDKIIRWGNAISSIQALPALRGLWPMSSVVGGPTIPSGGNANDLSGNGLTLTYNGNPTYNFDSSLIFPHYIDVDGTGDYLSKADTGANDPLDIIGTETYIASGIRGLTFGGWFYPTASANGLMIGKADDLNGPYFLLNEGGTNALFRIRDSGDAANFTVRTPITLNVWQYIVGRYTPSTEIKIWDNRTSNTFLVGIPAAILNGTDGFAIGATGAGTILFTGRASLCWVCAAALDDIHIISLFEQQRVLFGV